MKTNKSKKLTTREKQLVTQSFLMGLTLGFTIGFYVLGRIAI